MLAMMIKVNVSTLLMDLLQTVHSHEFYFFKYTFDTQVMYDYYYIWLTIYVAIVGLNNIDVQYHVLVILHLPMKPLGHSLLGKCVYNLAHNVYC